MSPERKCWINGKLIEEYYWSRQMVVYVDHHAVDLTYEEAVEAAKSETSAT